MYNFMPEETYLLIFFICVKSVSVVGGFAVTKMAEAEAVDVEKKNEEGEEKSQEELIKESIAAAVMKVLIQSCAH